jgi:hypothetical protein
MEKAFLGVLVPIVREAGTISPLRSFAYLRCSKV